MSRESIVFLLIILNVNAYVNVILERSLRANEGHIAGFQCHAIQNRSKLKSKPVNRFFLCEIRGEIFYPNL